MASRVGDEQSDGLPYNKERGRNRDSGPFGKDNEWD